MKQALQRLRTGGLTESRWKQWFMPLARHKEPLHGIESPAFREWVRDPRVGHDLIALAKARLHQRPAANVQQTLIESLIKHAGATPQSAAEIVDRAINTLVASPIAKIPSDQKRIAAFIRNRPEQTYTLDPDPVTRDIHTKVATAELRSILSTRDFEHTHPRKEVQTLLMRVTKGDLSATDAKTTNHIRYWTARLCASDHATLNVARTLRSAVRTDDSALDLTIVDALITETAGNPDLAIRTLRDPHSPDQKAALFATLARVRGHAVALDWFDKQDHAIGVGFFTAHGWRTWGTAMARSGKWSDAAAYLSRFESSWPEAPGLALIEGVINAAMLLPEDERPRALRSVPMYYQICLHRTRETAKHHARAVLCFRAVQDHHICQNHHEFREEIHIWLTWLGLMNPDPTQEMTARDAVANQLGSGRRAVSLAPLAWAFRIRYDDAVLTDWLRQRRPGGLNPQERLAECFVNHHSMVPRDFVNYLDSHRPELEDAVPVRTLALMKVQALFDDGQIEQAQAWLDRSKDILGEPLTTRIELTIRGGIGDDQRQRLQALYQQTQSLPDLRILIEHLEASTEASKNKETLLAYFHKFFEKERTSENAARLAKRLDSSRAKLQFLADNSDLVDRSADLQAMKAGALFSAGRFGEAQTLNKILLNTRTEWVDIHFAGRIAISTGSWEDLPNLVNQVWKRRDSLDAEPLIQFAYFAGEADRTPSRAVRMAQLAAEKAPTTPEILMAAYMLHTQLGCDNELSSEWLETATEQSSQAGGPVWKTSLRSIVEEWIPQRRAHFRQMEQSLVAGKTPFSLAVEQTNIPLSGVFLHASEQNAALTDGRNRGVLPIIAANKGNVDIEADWTVGLDLTSVLVLEYLDLLGPTLDSLHKVAFSADIFEWLFIERKTVRFRQPSLVQDAKHLLEHHRTGSLRPIDISQFSASQVSNEVGTELAALLAEAQKAGGVVVCARPIHRPDSMMDEEAKTDDFDDFLVTPRDLFTLLHQKGKLSLADHARARQLLSPLHRRSSPGIPPSALEHAIHLGPLALGQIQRAGLLPALTSAGLDLRIHPVVLAEAKALVAQSDVGNTLAVRIDAIRNTLRDAIQAGKAFQLQRAPDDRARPRTGHHAFNSTASLLRAAGVCNALCIDDRSLNRRAGFLDSTGQTKPIASVLDVLRALRNRQAITADDYWSARHRLRRGGFAFIPPEREELSYWAKSTTIAEDHLIEGVELRTMRQAIARIAVHQIATGPEAVALEPEHMAMMAKAMLDIWAEPDTVPDEMAVRASHLWRYATDLIGITHTSLPPERQSALVRELIVTNLMFLFLPRGVVSDKFEATYGDWIEKDILSRLLPANADLVRDALDEAYRDIRSSDKHRWVLGRLFFVQLPDRLRREAIAKAPKFAHWCGFDMHHMILLSKEVSISFMALVRGVRSSFGTDPTEQITADDGRNIRIETSAKKPYVTAHWTECGRPRTAHLPAFAIFAPTANLRKAALHSLVNSCSLAFHDFDPLLSSVKQRVPTPQEVEPAVREVTHGVNATQAAFEQKLGQQPRIDLADIVPERLDYFDRFAGPDPRAMPPEQYILETLAPHRKNLLERDLPRGLEVCCLGALRDDLCPGQWLSDVTDDAVWTALTAPPLRDARSPFALLGILDVALYRLDDERFRELAGHTAVALVDDDLKRGDGVDIYRLLEVLASLVRNRINLIEGGATRPGYWKRMCALMHAGWMCRIMGNTLSKPDIDSFVSWARGQRSAAGRYAALVDARSEPLLEAGLIHAPFLRDEVLGRLRLLQVRHESDGRKILRSKELSAVFARIAAVQDRLFGFPGPLELHQTPKATVPTAVLQAGEKEYPIDQKSSILHVMAFYSQRGVLADKDLCRARSRVRDFGSDKNGANMADELTELSRASVIAAAHRDTHLADAVGEALERLSAKVASASAEIEVQKILRIALQSAAAYEAEKDWSKWLETRLRSVAEALPGPPNNALGAFLAHLRAIEVVVPRELWFHIPARTVAISGSA